MGRGEEKEGEGAKGGGGSLGRGWAGTMSSQARKPQSDCPEKKQKDCPS